MGNQQEKSNQVTLTIATLNYSGIIRSPYEFHEAGDSFKALIGQYFYEFAEEENLRWDFGKLDVIWQEGRFSPLYMPDCGIKNQTYMMGQK